MLRKSNSITIKYGSKGFYDVFDYTNKERYSYDIKLVKNQFSMKEEVFSNNTFELINDKEEIIGFFGYSIMNEYLVVDLYYINLESRKKGYSKILNLKIESLIEENNLKGFYFLVNSFNTEFIDFLLKKDYEVAGFIKINKLDIKLFFRRKIN